MASRGLGYDYGTGGSNAVGKIRRRTASRAAASPYARPAPVPSPAAATATAASKGGGWFSRLVSAGASRLLPSLFRKPPPQLAAPLSAPPEPQDATHSRPEAWQGPLILTPGSVQIEPEPLNAPPSPSPPPLEDDLPEGEESGGADGNILANENSANGREENMLRNSDEHNVLNLEDLLKLRTFKRSEFEYLSELLWSRTVGSNTLKPFNGNVKKMHVSEKETANMCSSLHVDFSSGTHRVSDLVASPAEIAKAYMGLKSANGSSLRLRLHDPSSLTIKSMEANTMQQARPPSIPLQGSRLHTSKHFDHLTSNFSTPNRSSICKMSSSPYFKGAASDDLFSNVSSSYQTPSSVHTIGRQVLKRKSTAANNEMVCVGPIRKMHQRYNRTSPLLETRPGYRGHLGSHGSKLNEDSEHSAQTQKRRCLSKVCDTTTLVGLDVTAYASSFGQAPVQSTEMAANILKQLDTLVPSEKEVTPETKQKNGDSMDTETHVSHKKKVSVQSNLSEPSTSGVKENSLINGINSNITFTPAQVTEKNVDATSKTSPSLTESISRITSPKDKPPMFPSSSHPPSLVLSKDVDWNKMPIASNGFSFPAPAVLGIHSQAPPTPTMASPPILPIEKLQPSTASSASVTSIESGPRITKSVLEEGFTPRKFDKLNANEQPMSSKSSGQVASFTSNPVFKFANTKLASLSNDLHHTSNSNGSISKASTPIAGSCTISTDPASLSAQNVSAGASVAISSSATGSLPSVTAATAPPFTTASMVSSGAGSGSAPFSSFPQFGAASSSVTEDKTKAASSSMPFSFSQKFVTSSSTGQDKSKAACPEPTCFSGNQHAQSGNSSSMPAQYSMHNLSFKAPEKPTGLNSQSSAYSPVGSAPFSSSSIFCLGAVSGSTSVSAAVSTFSPISSSSTGSGPAFSAPPLFSSKYGSAPNAVFSFAAATTSIPNSSPTTPIFGGVSLANVSTTGTGQMNGGNMFIDRKESPFSTTSPFCIPSNSPSTPNFSSPATQFTASTTPSTEIFKFGGQNISSGAFSMGPGGGNEKSGRKFIRVKRKK